MAVPCSGPACATNDRFRRPRPGSPQGLPCRGLVVHTAVPRAEMSFGGALSALPGLLLDAIGQLGDRVERAPPLGELAADAVVRVHHRRVVPTTELLADLGQRQVSQLPA